MPKQYQVGAYYFANYHVDPRNEQVHGPGWTEWELVKTARPRFPGHVQPRVPVWGYCDEADPKVMEMKIDAAADHALDYWIFDWYWYDDGPYLNRCLDEGYMGAANNARVKFCCMWANHDWSDIHPAKLRETYKTLYPGKVTPDTFERITDHVIERYFTHPSHFNVDGAPYFSVYDLSKLVENFGGLSETRRALDRFRAKTQSAGFPDLHLNAVAWGQAILPGEVAPTDIAYVIDQLGFDSITSYVWVHHAWMETFPETEYMLMFQRYLEHWDRVDQEYEIPYYPNATMGWDSSPRTVQSDSFINTGYPFGPSLANNTPERFAEALRVIKRRLDARPGGPRILNINAWNEWTEGSYLEPDTVHGMGYLEAIRDVFGRES